MDDNVKYDVDTPQKTPWAKKVKRATYLDDKKAIFVAQYKSVANYVAEAWKYEPDEWAYVCINVVGLLNGVAPNDEGEPVIYVYLPGYSEHSSYVRNLLLGLRARGFDATYIPQM